LQKPQKHWVGHGCLKCANTRKAAASSIRLRLPVDEFLEAANTKFNNAFLYDTYAYVGLKTKIRVYCITHNHWYEQQASKHLKSVRGGCALCVRDSRCINETTFLSKARMLYGDQYDYSQVLFTIGSDPIVVLCKVHGPFSTTPARHMRLHGGCHKCGTAAAGLRRRITTEEFVNRAQSAHGCDRFDYENTKYITDKVRVTIRCKVHDEEFLTNPMNHIGAYSGGCRKCIAKQTSVISLEWLRYIEVQTERELQTIQSPEGEYRICTKRKYAVDGYCHATRTVYEFHGDFWHGNPKMYAATSVNSVSGKTFGNLYSATCEKRKYIEQAGYTYIYVWESQWRAGRRAVIRLQRIWRMLKRNCFDT
jgi:G:T-mismatch repair DNA endonuclease (very short patch repair protein)